MRLSSTFDPSADLVLYEGNCLDLLRQVPDGLVKLVVTSPPYNPGEPDWNYCRDAQEYVGQALW
jgi:hypothetical protein